MTMHGSFERESLILDAPHSASSGRDAESSSKDGIDEEHRRIESRRSDRGISDSDGKSLPRWGLALSGGGIRSATFCLGVLQGLAKENIATCSDLTSSEETNRTKCLLERFDYLSTVSGGSYIGAFFGSLFVPGRMTCVQAENPTAAADRAYRTLAIDPPGRIYPSEPRDESGTKAIAWLRENGRYLTPTGAGDLSYAIALLIRNWLAITFLIFSILLFVLSLIALFRQLLHLYDPFSFVRVFDTDLLKGAVYNASGISIWWSDAWALCVVPLVVFSVPNCVAYWLVYSEQNASDDQAKLRGKPLILSLVVCASLLFSAHETWATRGANGLFWICAVGLLDLLLALFVAKWQTRDDIRVAEYRVRVTWSLSTSMLWTVALVALSFADTVSQSLYLYAFRHHGHPFALTLPAGLAGLIAALVTQGARLYDGRGSGGILSKLPLSVMAGIPAVLIALLIFASTNFVILWMRWCGGAPDPALIGHDVWGKASDFSTQVVLIYLTMFSCILTLITGRFGGFLNLSTLQSLYAARLARSYLGATNGKRFPSQEDFDAQKRSHSRGPATMDAIARRNASVASPVENDDLSLNEYFHPRNRGPVHLINATMNLTLDPSDQIVQRDRKGQPVCIAPAKCDAAVAANNVPPDYFARFVVDGDPVRQARASRPRNEIEQPRRLSEWVAISGAAISTGLGRTTSLGTSLMLGLANVRLGSWWAASSQSTHLQEVPRITRILSMLCKTHLHLGYELFARFYGMRREWQYLSDGGHFENMGVYELLRPERGVSVIVACDCGADPMFEFGDLGNLIRLTRIDFKVEVEVDETPKADPELRKLFGVPADFRNSEAPASLCAMLFNVYRPAEPNSPNRQLVARIVLLKPRMIDTVHADLLQYKIDSPSFPHETTADQFFNQAQWESYRKLGLCIATRVFGRESEGGHGQQVALLLGFRKREEVSG